VIHNRWGSQAHHQPTKFQHSQSTQLTAFNPDEQVWKNIKERVAKQIPRDKYEMRVMLRNALERLQSLPEIIRGFFAHPECGFVN
jgi:hypothetical protein